MRQEPIERMDVLGVPVSVVNMRSGLAAITDWARAKDGARLVFLRDVHGLMRAVDNAEFRELHRTADLVMPDGMPLTWIGRLRGHGLKIGRTSGADVVDAVCAASLRPQMTHFFYGGRPGVAEKMVQRLKARHPGLKVAGLYSPPMREIGTEEALDDDLMAEIDMIRQSGADFIWIGISTPKQEILMARMAPLLDHGVLFGVGAAFDFHAGLVKRAPRWMRDNGLEWLHRLISEPKRLWRRYLVMAPRFMIMLVVQGFGK